VAATVSAESFTEAVVQRAIDSRPAEHAGAAARNRTEPSEAEASATATQATAKAEGGAPALGHARRLQETAIPGTCASDQLAERGQAAMQSCCAGGEAECTQLPERCIGPGSFFFFFLR
jgi:hypothetical protein